MKFQVAKASHVADEVIPDVEIQIGPGIPPNVNSGNYEAVYRQCFQADATRLMEALTSLPGGTWDRLFALMVEKKASLLRVPLFERKAPEPTPLTGKCPACGKECHFTNDGAVLPHRPPFGRTANCRGVIKVESSTADFPTILQSVLRVADNDHALHLNVEETSSLATEIRKLLERWSIPETKPLAGNYNPKTLLHILWTKAVGTERYDKPQWIDLEAFLDELGKRRQ